MSLSATGHQADQALECFHIITSSFFPTATTSLKWLPPGLLMAYKWHPTIHWSSHVLPIHYVTNVAIGFKFVSVIKLFEGQLFPPSPVLDFGQLLPLVDFKTWLNPQLVIFHTFSIQLKTVGILGKVKSKVKLKSAFFPNFGIIFHFSWKIFARNV